MINMISVRDRFSKVRYRVLRDYPFYGEISASLNHEFIDSDFIPLMATDGKNIFINLKNIEKLDDADIFFSYIHEIKHCMLLHHHIHKRFSDLDTFILNIAEDIIVNELTIKEFPPTFEFRQKLATKEKYEELRNLDVLKLSSLEIYHIIYKRFKKILSKFKLFGKGGKSSLPTGGVKGGGIGDFIKDLEKKISAFSKEVDKKVDKGEISEFEGWTLKYAFKDYLLRKKFQNMSEEEKKKIIGDIKDAIFRGYHLAKLRGTLPAGY